MAGYFASNIIDENVKTVQWHEIDQVIEQGGLLIDVRMLESLLNEKMDILTVQ